MEKKKEATVVYWGYSGTVYLLGLVGNMDN